MLRRLSDESNLAERIIRFGAASLGAARQYASSASTPRSVLADTSLDAVFGRHFEARAQLNESVRDNVRSSLAKALGRRSDRPLDVESLQKLPASELAAACRTARLPPSDDPAAMARALHAMLGPAASAPRGVSQSVAPWQQSAPPQRPSWPRAGEAATGASTSVPGVEGRATAAGGSATEQASPGSVGNAQPSTGAVNVASSAAADAMDPEDAAAAELLAAAEREADELFAGELQRRLQQATGAATAPAAAPAAEARSETGPRTNAPAPPSVAPQPRPTPSVPAARDEPPAPVPSSAQQGQTVTRLARTPLFPFLATTEQLAATEPGPAASETAPIGVSGSVAAGLGSVSSGPAWAGSVPGGGAPASPYGPQLGQRPHSSEVYRAVRRCLLRQGYSGKDPRQMRSLLLLRRADLAWLLRDFCGVPEDELLGQGREQLAARLLQLMAPEAPANATSAAAVVPAGLATAPAAPEAPRAAKRAAVLFDAEAEPEVEAWDEEAASLGDPRRREVLAAARRRRQLMAMAAQPEEIATWLVKARAQDVVLISLPASGRQRPTATAAADAAASASYVVLATGLSQRHAYACAHAVRYQIRERLQELAGTSEFPARGSPSSGSHDVPGAPTVAGVNGADWLSLEAGSVQVHVLTPQARQYYRLEDVFLGPGGMAAAAVGPAVGQQGDPRVGFAAGGGGGIARPRPTVKLFGAAAGEPQPETLETARVDAATR